MEWQIPVPLATAKAPLLVGGTIPLRRHGNSGGRRPVVSHANGLSAGAYLPFWSLLTVEFDIILLDLPGHGDNRSGT